MDPIRVFIGSGDASALECGTLVYSLHTHTRRPLDIAVFNGTTRTLYREGRSVPAGEVLAKLTGGAFATEFSLFRYAIPELCGREGRAIYIDSDMVCLADIGDLFDVALDGSALAARRDAYPEIGRDRWATSLMVIDCERAQFDLHAILDDIRQRRYTYTEFSQFAPRYLEHHPARICPLDGGWNTFDAYDATTKIVHYTDLDRQPWKYRYHPYGDLWFRCFHEAIAAGFVSRADVDTAIARGYVRDDIMLGNNGRDTLAERAAAVRQRLLLSIRDRIRRAAYATGWAR